ncbi:FAD-dependent oxidoreductase, partial [Sutterella massiliensis]
MNQSRRSLLKFSAASVVAAGLASKASAVPIAPPKKWDEEYDIVIVGAGGAGLAAGVVAAQKGLKAVILEKEAFIGGSSALCGGKWAVADTAEQRAKGIKDSPEIFLNDMLKTGQNKNDPELVKAFIKASREHYDFMTKERGLKPIEIVAASGMSVPRAHNFKPSGVLNDMKKYVLEHGVSLVLNTRVERLVWDAENEAIAGVRVAAKNGVRWIKARKGVLLAAGGFSMNKKLLEKYAPLMLRADATAGAGCTGDG